MAEPGLSIGFSDLQLAIAELLGYGPIATLTVDELAQIDRMIQRGYNRFLKPPVLAGERNVHMWRFLEPPAADLVLVSGTDTYDLPDNYGGVQGTFTYGANQFNSWVIRLIPINQLRTKQQMSPTSASANGRPLWAAVRPKLMDGSTGQRHEVVFFPVPNAAFTLQYSYRLRLDPLTASRPFPLGGAEHAETLLEAVLSIAEKQLGDTQGLHYQEFLAELQSSISIDNQTTKADTVGYNNNENRGAPGNFNRTSLVTVNGLTPT